MSSIVEEELQKINEEYSEDAGARAHAEISFHDRYPNMIATSENQRLLDMMSKVSQELGFGPVTPLDPNSAGSADISFTAPFAKAKLDGLGPLGDGVHSVNETVDLRTIPTAAKRAAVLLLRLNQ